MFTNIIAQYWIKLALYAEALNELDKSIYYYQCNDFFTNQITTKEKENLK